LEPPLCVVFNWIKRVYTILVWNTISGFSNLDISCYHCLILTLIFHLKVLINFFFFFFIFIIIIINSIIGIIIIIITTITTTTTTTTTTIIIIIVTIVVVLLLFIIYTISLPVVRPRSCQVIYYFDTPALGRRHQSFGRANGQGEWIVNLDKWCLKRMAEFKIMVDCKNWCIYMYCKLCIPRTWRNYKCHALNMR
jgi:hypothetical protein